MKKILISSALTLSALSFAHAQAVDVAVTAVGVEAQAQVVSTTTGNTAIDAQVKALQKEMEAKIKALREEYQAKIKAIVGDKKPMIVRPNGATSTVKEIRKEIKEQRKDYMEDRREMRAEMRASTTATGTVALPRDENRRLRDLFRNFFGLGSNN